MECTITIDNINESEVLSYPIVLLKGTVIKQSDCSLPEEIFVNSSGYKLHNNKFKCLVELKLGDNLIKLKCCCVDKEFRVIYTPRISNLTVRPLYIICKGHDGKFQAPEFERNDVESACKRISIGCKLLQSVLAEKLYESNFGRKTFVLEDCDIFHSSLDVEVAKKMKQDELWGSLGREIMESKIGSENIKYIGFLSCTYYHGDEYREEKSGHDDLIDITDAYIALGGGGLGLFGTACLYTWPETVEAVLDHFKDEKIVDKHKFLDDSAYRGTNGACFSTTLGSVLHELCHTFDLGHTDLGIMGRGFDNIQNVFLLHETTSKKSIEMETCPSQKHESLVSIKIKDADSKSFIRKTQFSNDIINKSICIDDTCFTKSSVFILAHHKWFNSFPASDKKFILSYDETINLIKSTLGIRVIEIRRTSDEMVILNWCFTGKILKYNCQIDTEALHTLQNDNYTLFVEDNEGNILKLDKL